MASIRTQIYLTSDLRARLDDVMRRERKPMAQVIREALEAHLKPAQLAPEDALTSTFGVLPDISVLKRDEWDRV